MNKDLSEALSLIKPGDFVVARFGSKNTGEYTVAGVVRFSVESLYVGTDLLDPNPQFLVAIESHEPAKPPVPPEPKPTDDLVLLDVQDRPITRFLSAWRDWSTGEYVAWEHLDWPLRVYVPKPSLERIEELAVKYAKEEYGGGCTVHMAIVRAIREAFGGEQ